MSAFCASKYHKLWLVVLVWSALVLQCPSVIAQQSKPTDEQGGGVFEDRRTKRQKRREEKARQDSIAKAQAKTTENATGADTGATKKRGFFSSIFGSKAENLYDPDSVAKANKELAGYEDAYEKAIRQGNYKEALNFLELYQAARDSLAEVTIQASMAQLDAAAARKENEYLQQENQLAKERAQLAEDEARLQTYINYGMGLGLLLVAGFVVVLVRSVRQKRKANAQLAEKNGLLAEKNEEISQAYEEIQAQQDTLEHQHKNILESIQYARRIQEAILPEGESLQEALPNHFIFYKPKDIVSGDFYWFYTSPTRTFLAAVDCTGHGVPGAFMSVLGISLLNQIVRDEPDLAPCDILDRLHQDVMRNLHQIGATGFQSQDGMDIALVALNHERTIMEFAGANNPLYILRNGELEEIKGDRAPIGGSRFIQHRFANYKVEISDGDSFYLFSDGMADQFGGPKGRKYTYKRLREIISNLHGQPMPVQLDIFSEEFDAWRGNKEQIDDVLVIGVRV